jgi:hypothetical protein
LSHNARKPVRSTRALPRESEERERERDDNATSAERGGECRGAASVFVFVFFFSRRLLWKNALWKQFPIRFFFSFFFSVYKRREGEDVGGFVRQGSNVVFCVEIVVDDGVDGASTDGARSSSKSPEKNRRRCDFYKQQQKERVLHERRTERDVRLFAISLDEV